MKGGKKLWPDPGNKMSDFLALRKKQQATDVLNKLDDPQVAKALLDKFHQQELENATSRTLPQTGHRKMSSFGASKTFNHTTYMSEKPYSQSQGRISQAPIRAGVNYYFDHIHEANRKQISTGNRQRHKNFIPLSDKKKTYEEKFNHYFAQLTQSSDNLAKTQVPKS